MSDNFEEVDDILSEVGSETSEIESTDLAEKNFNDSELQDIMAEIESLEKEFETEAVIEPKVMPVEAIKMSKQTDLQNEIDRELEMSLGMLEDDKNEMKSDTSNSIKAEPEVLSFEKKSATPLVTSATNNSSSEISFEAHGQMKLCLGFKIGEESAKLTIDPVKGLVVTMSGVELCINLEEGCKVMMDSGAKFTIPLTSHESALKKKSA